MKELSLHILDLVQNSIAAKADLIGLYVIENTKENLLKIIVEDNGIGMDKELLLKVEDPFTTTRTTRKVGLGIPLLKAAAERCQGSFDIISQKGVGTKIEAIFQYDHIDRAPLGNMPETIVAILLSLGEGELVYTQCRNGKEFTFDTREIRTILGDDVSICQSEVIIWIKEYIQDGLKNLCGGVE